jgi:hypothetical protein
MSSNPVLGNSGEELGRYHQRFSQFMNLWTVYDDLLTGEYVPSLNSEDYPVSMTLMFLLYAYFYSLIEDSEDGLNGFRVWRKELPQEELVIAAVEAIVKPMAADLRVFRDRLGFHGSRTSNHESPGFDIFNEHSGTDVLNAIKRFKTMNAWLFGLHTALQENDRVKIAHWRRELDKLTARVTVAPMP